MDSLTNQKIKQIPQFVKSTSCQPDHWYLYAVMSLGDFIQISTAKGLSENTQSETFEFRQQNATQNHKYP